MTDRVGRPLAWVLATYAAWVGATYLLEGLPRTLQRPEAEGLRALYAVLANLLVGVGGSGLVLARVFEQHSLPTAAAGVNPPRSTIIIVCVGLAAGAAVYGLQSPPSRTAGVLVTHNFLTLHGVLSALEQTPAVHSSEIRVPLVVLGVMTLLVLGVVHWWLRRTMARCQEPRPATRG